MPLSPRVAAVAEAIREAEVVELAGAGRRGSFSVGGPPVLLLGEDATLTILFDGLDFEVLKNVHSTPRAELKVESKCNEGKPSIRCDD